jgi:hypothetical protein
VDKVFDSMRRKTVEVGVFAVLTAFALFALPSGGSAAVTNTTITSGPSGTIGTDSATFTFTSPLKGGFRCRLDSSRWSDWEWCASPKVYADLADGPHRFEVRAVHHHWDDWHVDPTPAVAEFVVDTTPPETTITEAPSGTIGTGSASVEFTASEPGTFECRLDSAEPGDWTPCTSPQSYTSLADGPHAFEVRAVNEAGNADPTPALATFSVDTTPPETTITEGPSGTIGTSSASFAFASSEPGSFECRLDSTGPGGWSPCTSSKSYTSLADGPHVFEVRATDELGNVDPTPAADSFVVYTGPPLPVAGETVNLEPVEGTVELQCPGEDQYSRLTSFKQVPLGCLINTRHGTVDLTASKGSSGELQGGHFWGGLFVVGQESGDNEAVDLKLAGRRMCERRNSPSGRMATLSRARRGGGRKVWGSGKGNYTTSGSYGSATVRGTTWLVVDRCDSSTLIKVTEGTVWARDFVKEKSIVLTAGQQYIAKAAIPRLDPEQWP